MKSIEVELFYMSANGHWLVVMFDTTQEAIRIYVDGTLEHLIYVLPKFKI